MHTHIASDPRIFVFGSNLRGIHGAGAARYARLELGARPGVSEGLTGRSYALPTCSRPGVPLPLDLFAAAVGRFLTYAKEYARLHFFVSAVGCGIAGYAEDEIAPLFRGAPGNCDLPPGWVSLPARFLPPGWVSL